MKRKRITCIKLQVKGSRVDERVKVYVRPKSRALTQLESLFN